MTYELIIFDCDGTLVDSEYMNCLSASQAFIAAGFSRYTYDVIYNEFVGVTIKEIMAIIEDETGRKVPEDMPDRIIERVAENTAVYLKPVDGVREAVSWAADKFKICVGSNGERVNVVNSIKTAGLAELLTEDRIYTSAMVAKGKPAPDLFLMAAEKLAADPAKTLVVEDTVVGVTAAKAAGMSVIGFIKMHAADPNYAGKLKKAGADHIMHDWAEFFALADK